MRGNERVIDIDRPSLRDDRYAEQQYLGGRISYQEYTDVVNFYHIYSDFYMNRIAKIREKLTKRYNRPAADREVFNYLETYVD